MDEKIELFLKGKMDKIEADEFREQLNSDEALRERAITMAILLKSMKRVSAERNQEFINEIYYSKIDSYLKGNMNMEEVSEFKLLLERNEELQNRTISKAIFLKTLKKAGKENNQEIIDNIKSKKKTSAKKSFNLFIRYTSAIAASICILFYVDFQVEKINTQTLGAEFLAYAPTFEGDGQYKGVSEETDIESELEYIFKNVKSNQGLEDNKMQLLELYDQAKSKRLNRYSDYVDYIGYYLAISYLQNNEKDMAINVLSELLVNNPDFEAANKLLNEIKEIKGIW